MLKQSIIALSLSGLALAVTAGAAQAQTEAKTWLIPWSGDAGDVGPAPPAASTIQVFNMNGHEVRVDVVPYDGNGAVQKALAKGAPLKAGGSTSWSFYPNQPFAYALVIATEPVIVSASANTLARVKQHAINTSLPGGGRPGFIEGGSAAGGIMRGFEYFVRSDARAIAIDCAGKDATHFACSQKAPAPGPTVGTFNPNIVAQPKVGTFQKQPKPGDKKD